jgi:hypothetical protein
MTADSAAEKSLRFKKGDLSPVILRFEDTPGVYLRYRVTEVRANGEVALQAIDVPRFSRVISMEAFEKGMIFMKRQLGSMGRVSRSIMFNFIEIDGFYTD